MAHRKCIVDLTEYKYCPNCGDDANETWRFIYCSEKCRSIDKILQGYVAGNIDALAAQYSLNRIGFDIEKMDSTVKKTIEQIYSVKSPVVEEPTKITEETVDKIRGKRKKTNIADEKIDE